MTAKLSTGGVQERFKASDWRNIVNLRNIIAHRYDRVQPETLWNIITTVLPGLLIQLESLLPPLPLDEDLPE